MTSRTVSFRELAAVAGVHERTISANAARLIDLLDLPVRRVRGTTWRRCR